jgi:hypothetical protein
VVNIIGVGDKVEYLFLVVILRRAVRPNYLGLNIADLARAYEREDSFSEHATFSLPAGFVVDEIRDPVTIDTPCGYYSAKYEVRDGKLLFSRSTAIRFAGK